MFDNREYTHKDTYETAKEKRKIKKELFNISKQEFSEMGEIKLKYYKCVNDALHDDNLQGKFLDRAIVQCKLRLKKVEKYVSDTNFHAKTKVDRCIKSKRGWARQFNSDLATEEKGVWDCLNRYHRRYLYYYPDIKANQFSL